MDERRVYQERVEALQVAPTGRLHQTKPLMQRFQVLSRGIVPSLFPRQCRYLNGISHSLWCQRIAVDRLKFPKESICGNLHRHGIVSCLEFLFQCPTS